MLIKSKTRFCLRAECSPTYYNLCLYLKEKKWAKTRFPTLAHFSEKNFQFSPIAAEQLEYKDLLARLMMQYCPQVMPPTFCINDSNWQSILQAVAIRFDSKDNWVWILKPAQMNNGQYIKIFQSLGQLERHYLSSKRMGGDHVLQQYLTNPHLLKGPTEGHKYSIRMFVILTNYAGAYLYPEGYFNVALKPYQPCDFTNLRAHLTNEHLQEDTLNVIQIPSKQIQLFKPFYKQIKSIVSTVIQALQRENPEAFVCSKERTLALFGFDFMVDALEKVWLLEANHGPCFPKSAEHPLHQSLYYDFWQDFIASFVNPIATRQVVEQIQYQLFESLGTSC